MNRRSQNDSKEKDKRIANIILRLSTLAIETKELTAELQIITESNTTTSTFIPNETDHSFQIGESVIITNNYQGKQGTRGTVIHISKKQIKIKDKEGIVHTRLHRNIRHHE